MRTEDQRLRLRVTRQDTPDRSKLVEWVLGIAEERHRAFINGEPDPFGRSVPVDLSSHAAPKEHGARNSLEPSTADTKDSAGLTLAPTTRTGAGRQVPANFAGPSPKATDDAT